MKLRHIARPQALLLLALGANLAGLGLSLFASQPAHAQFFYREPAISEHELLRNLRRQGFRGMTPPVLNRDVFVLDAVSPRGEPVRLIVSAFDGRIVDSHSQRRQWTRVDPDDDEYPDRRWRRDPRWSRTDPGWPDYRRREWDYGRSGRFEDERTREPYSGRLPDEPRYGDTGVQPPAPQPQRPPERVTVAPPPVATTPRDPDLPAPTLRNPTIVKRSPTAIPRDPNETPATRPPSISTAPPPGAGTRDKPRVIELTPKAPPPPKPTAAPAPQPPKTAGPAITTGRPAPRASDIPPPAVLDSPPSVPRPAEPVIPPATLE